MLGIFSLSDAIWGCDAADVTLDARFLLRIVLIRVTL
jgi:hypothetical protein